MALTYGVPTNVAVGGGDAVGLDVALPVGEGDGVAFGVELWLALALAAGVADATAVASSRDRAKIAITATDTTSRSAITRSRRAAMHPCAAIDAPLEDGLPQRRRHQLHGERRGAIALIEDRIHLGDLK